VLLDELRGRIVNHDAGNLKFHVHRVCILSRAHPEEGSVTRPASRVRSRGGGGGGLNRILAADGRRGGQPRESQRVLIEGVVAVHDGIRLLGRGDGVDSKALRSRLDKHGIRSTRVQADVAIAKFALRRGGHYHRGKGRRALDYLLRLRIGRVAHG
jgi:hypothetical protein